MTVVSYQVIFSGEPDPNDIIMVLEESMEENYIEVDEPYNFKIKYSKKLKDKFIIGIDIVIGELEDLDTETGSDEEIEEMGEIDVSRFFEVMPENEIEDNDEMITRILESFNEILIDNQADTIFKFQDDNLFKKLSNFYQSIFQIEMKLRETLTFIFVDTYKEDFYNLLKEIDLETNSFLSESNRVKLPQKLENEFFHMSFGTYKYLDKKKSVINLSEELIPLLEEIENIDELRKRITNRGIIKTEYKDFLAKIEEHLFNLQELRNCVAHNRTPSDDEIDNFRISSKKLEIAIKTFWKELK
jgi:hypothetical protein